MKSKASKNPILSSSKPSSSGELLLQLTDTLNTFDRMSFDLERLIVETLDKLDVREIEINAELQDIREQIDVNSNTITDKNDVPCFGMPYFKTHDFQPFPLNNDFHEKQEKGELISHELPVMTNWTSKEIDLIQNAVAESIAGKELDKVNLCLESTISDSTQRKQLSKKEWVKWNRKPLEELALDPDEEFDWDKISCYVFRKKRSPEECRSMWHLYAKPSIAKSYWPKDEDNRLKQLVKDNNYQNWEAIAKDLNTGRSGYQCFVQYVQRLHKLKQPGKWTQKEDDKLCRIVDLCRVGSFIPWHKVSYYFDNRTLKQIVGHWSNSLNPAIKKGHFSRSEDFGLCVGVQRYGKNFCKIATIFGNRNATQIRGRYQSQMNDSISGHWSKEEDARLIELVNKYGSKWSQVSKYLCRNRTQCRSRYSRLKDKYNFNLDKIKRNTDSKPLYAYEKTWFQEFCCKNSDVKSLPVIPRNFAIKSKRGRKKSNFTIENQLLDFFDEAFFDNCPVYKNSVIKDKVKLEDAAKSLKNILTLFKVNINLPSNITETYIQQKDTNQVADTTTIKLILQLAALYKAEASQSSFKPVANGVSLMEVEKEIDYDCKTIDKSKTQLSSFFWCCNKSYNRASTSNLIHWEMEEFYVEPQHEEFLYENDLQSALTAKARADLGTARRKSLETRIQATSASAATSTSETKTKLDYLFPPNAVSLLGLRTFMLGRKKLWNMSGETGQLEIVSENNETNLNSDAFCTAQNLALSRCATLLFWPLLLSYYSPEEMGYSDDQRANFLNFGTNLSPQNLEEVPSNNVRKIVTNNSVKWQRSLMRKRKASVNINNAKTKSKKQVNCEGDSHNDTKIAESKDNLIITPSAGAASMIKRSSVPSGASESS